WYLLTLILMLCSAPLILYWQNVVSPAGVLIGPPAIVLTSIALISGFLFLITWPIGGGLSWPFAWLTDQSISVCEWFVRGADRLPGACWYLPSPPIWWLIGFYTILIGALAGVRLGPIKTSLGSRFTPLVRPSVPAILLGAWTSLGLLVGAWKPASDELHVHFLAVGHGGCVVIVTPERRVLLYDAGSLSGPEVTRRHIAPFLWSLGVSRVDELFVSHGDLDHFNGLPALADRFAIGQVTLTPSFEQRHAPGVQHVMNDLRRRQIAIRETWADDQFRSGDVQFRVLHPPTQGPDGPENARSLVMLIEHAGHRILLTGDLEKKGLDWVLELPPQPVDVLMAPHHGSRTANTEKLVTWASPRLAIASDGPKQAGTKEEDIYTKKKIPYWITWPHGMITLRSHRTGLIAESFRTGQRMVVATAGR
ncbi:MAG: MBL fold metallo-hydrolase, partial [Planctomycetes bacterium]|nr:MBL fold metallo-hydrolase [Planctomycetota bacterium]